jgi:hypothetical protein
MAEVDEEDGMAFVFDKAQALFCGFCVYAHVSSDSTTA